MKHSDLCCVNRAGKLACEPRHRIKRKGNTGISAEVKMKFGTES